MNGKKSVLPPKNLESSQRPATALSYQTVGAVRRTNTESWAEFPAMVDLSQGSVELYTLLPPCLSWGLSRSLGPGMGQARQQSAQGQEGNQTGAFELKLLPGTINMHGLDCTSFTEAGDSTE